MQGFAPEHVSRPDLVAGVHGWYRPIDEQIISAIEGKVAERRKQGAGGIKILGLAEGRSAPHSQTSNYGGPWLSRFIQAAFPGDCRVLATDLSDYLSPEYERLHFGLEARPNVDFDYLFRDLQGQHFDIIFGRHLEAITTGFPNLVSSVYSALANNGIATVHWDGLSAIDYPGASITIQKNDGKLTVNRTEQPV